MILLQLGGQINIATQAMNAQKHADVFLEVSEAFDNVPHH